MGLDIDVYKKSGEWVTNFRKINFVMQWLEDTFDKTEDELNCVDLFLNKEQLTDLYKRTETVISARSSDDNWRQVARETLPTCSGLFFGYTEYDDYYINDITFVNETIMKLLETETEIRVKVWW